MVSSASKSFIELRHLQAFLAVADERSFSRAANRLGISQPPLSRQIQRLEAKLDVQLFDRSHSQVQLTEAGRVFVQSARQIMHQMEQGIRDAQRVSQGLMGQLVVGIDGSAFACERAVQFIETRRAQLPELSIQVEEMDAPSQIEALQHQKINLGFVDAQFVAFANFPKAVVAQTVGHERLSVVLPTSHVLALAPQLSLLDIASEDFVLAPGWYDYVRSQIQSRYQMDFNPSIVQSAHEYRLLLSFVASGMGLSIVPASTEQHFYRSDIVYRPLQPSLDVDILSVIWQETQANPLVTAWIEDISAAILGTRGFAIAAPTTKRIVSPSA